MKKCKTGANDEAHEQDMLEQEQHSLEKQLKQMARQHSGRNDGASAKTYYRLMCALLNILSHYEANGYYVWPHWEHSESSLKIMTNAANYCCLPPSETVLAVLDTTPLVDRLFAGAGVLSLLFGCDGIYYNNNGPGHGTGSLSYSDFPRSSFAYSWLNSMIALGSNRSFNVNSSALSKSQIVEILTAIQKLVAA